MRETERTISVERMVEEEIELTKEEIIKYTVDNRNKTIVVEVRLFGEHTELVENETHHFFSDDFIKEPSEEDLWQLIDKKRSGQ